MKQFTLCLNLTEMAALSICIRYAASHDDPSVRGNAELARKAIWSTRWDARLDSSEVLIGGLTPDYIFQNGTLVPSAEALNELVDYWRRRAKHETI